MVYYIIHKCYNNYTFGALFARFNLKILLKIFVHVQFCSKFKFQYFYPLLFECYTYAVNLVIVDLRCVLVKISLSCLSQMLWRKVVYSVVRRIVRYSLWINQHRYFDPGRVLMLQFLLIQFYTVYEKVRHSLHDPYAITK